MLNADADQSRDVPQPEIPFLAENPDVIRIIGPIGAGHHRAVCFCLLLSFAYRITPHEISLNNRPRTMSVDKS